ncbi:MAG TPA: GNAT family N-acetyltransferase [Caulobacteraceae bacterium]|nr:GNAT family N-acetyltransferase [Caulobacteraceae bacterium]
MPGSDAIEIRPIRRDEAAAWRALRLEGLVNHPEAFSVSPEEFETLDMAAVAARMPEPGGDNIIFGVYEHGVLDGCAGFFRDTNLKERHKGTLWGVYLRPSLRGRGLGEALIDKVIEHARTRVEILKCVVNPESPGARRLYLGRGFRTYGMEPRALRVNGRDQDDELLALILKP